MFLVSSLHGKERNRQLGGRGGNNNKNCFCCMWLFSMSSNCFPLNTSCRNGSLQQTFQRKAGKIRWTFLSPLNSSVFINIGNFRLCGLLFPEFPSQHQGTLKQIKCGRKTVTSDKPENIIQDLNQEYMNKGHIYCGLEHFLNLGHFKLCGFQFD